MRRLHNGIDVACALLSFGVWRGVGLLVIEKEQFLEIALIFLWLFYGLVVS
jgi:hypothetical protein